MMLLHKDGSSVDDAMSFSGMKNSIAARKTGSMFELMEVSMGEITSQILEDEKQKEKVKKKAQ